MNSQPVSEGSKYPPSIAGQQFLVSYFAGHSGSGPAFYDANGIFVRHWAERHHLMACDVCGFLTGETLVQPESVVILPNCSLSMGTGNAAISSGNDRYFTAIGFVRCLAVVAHRRVQSFRGWAGRYFRARLVLLIERPG